MLDTSQMLRELLCIIHRDGGQHLHKWGLQESYDSAKFKVVDTYAKLDASDRQYKGYLQMNEYGTYQVHWEPPKT